MQMIRNHYQLIKCSKMYAFAEHCYAHDRALAANGASSRRPWRTHESRDMAELVSTQESIKACPDFRLESKQETRCNSQVADFKARRKSHGNMLNSLLGLSQPKTEYATTVNQSAAPLDIHLQSTEHSQGGRGECINSKKCRKSNAQVAIRSALTWVSTLFLPERQSLPISCHYWVDDRSLDPGRSAAGGRSTADRTYRHHRTHAC